MWNRSIKPIYKSVLKAVPHERNANKRKVFARQNVVLCYFGGGVIKMISRLVKNIFLFSRYWDNAYKLQSLADLVECSLNQSRQRWKDFEIQLSRQQAAGSRCRGKYHTSSARKSVIKCLSLKYKSENVVL